MASLQIPNQRYVNFQSALKKALEQQNINIQTPAPYLDEDVRLCIVFEQYKLNQRKNGIMERVDQLLHSTNGISSKYYHGTFKNCLRKFYYQNNVNEIRNNIIVMLQKGVEKDQITKQIVEENDAYELFVKQDVYRIDTELKLVAQEQKLCQSIQKQPTSAACSGQFNFSDFMVNSYKSSIYLGTNEEIELAVKPMQFQTSVQSNQLQTIEKQRTNDNINSLLQPELSQFDYLKNWPDITTPKMPQNHNFISKCQLSHLKNQQVKVKLQNNQVIQGVLDDFDTFMNLTLKNCCDEKGNNFKSCIIRGNSIISLF